MTETDISPCVRAVLPRGFADRDASPTSPPPKR